MTGIGIVGKVLLLILLLTFALWVFRRCAECKARHSAYKGFYRKQVADSALALPIPMSGRDYGPNQQVVERSPGSPTGTKGSQAIDGKGDQRPRPQLQYTMSLVKQPWRGMCTTTPTKKRQKNKTLRECGFKLLKLLNNLEDTITKFRRKVYDNIYDDIFGIK